MNIVRTPGKSTKVLVRRPDSSGQSADPSAEEDGRAKAVYQAVLGPGGSNLTSVRAELKGEVIGVVALTADKRKLVSDALAPANVIRVKARSLHPPDPPPSALALPGIVFLFFHSNARIGEVSSLAPPSAAHR